MIADVKSPRRRVRDLVKQRQPPQVPVFIPLLYSVAAQIEGIDIFDFVHNPTRLANGLTALQTMTETDGILCFSANHEVQEAFGALLDWNSYPATMTAGPDTIPTLADDTIVPRVLAHPRIETGLEVTRRLAQTAGKDPVLIVALSGPGTLATGFSNDQATSPELLEFAGRVTAALCRAYGEAGVHLVLVSECDASMLPGIDVTAWRSALTTVANIIRFFGALPVILFRQADDPLATAFKEQPVSGFLPGYSHNTGESPHAVHCLRPEPATWRMPAVPCSLLTTGREIPAHQDMGELRSACLILRQQ